MKKFNENQLFGKLTISKVYSMDGNVDPAQNPNLELLETLIP